MVAVSLKKNFFQAEDGIRDVAPSRGLGDVYKRQSESPKDHDPLDHPLDQSFIDFFPTHPKGQGWYHWDGQNNHLQGPLVIIVPKDQANEKAIEPIQG